jgi:hypothetical protein
MNVNCRPMITILAVQDKPFYHQCDLFCVDASLYGEITVPGHHCPMEPFRILDLLAALWELVLLPRLPDVVLWDTV